MRFGDRLKVSFEIAPDAQEALVPCFLLQPLIENAVVHGLRGAHKTGVIVVSAATQAGELVLTVTDNGIGLPQQDGAEMKSALGWGPRASASRGCIQTSYVSLRRPPHGGAEVHIAIPLQFAADEDRAPHDEQLAGANR